MGKSKIEWTDRVWNPVTGCTKVSHGCKNCYAESIANRFWGDRKFTDVLCHEDRLALPGSWKKGKMIFVNSMSDLFHDDVQDDFIDRVYKVMAENKQHTFQVLTKRPERMLEYYKKVYGGKDMLYEDVIPNIWLGVSVEDQKSADERIPLLLKTPAAIRWLSVEPLLDEIDISLIFARDIDWVVVGAESGANARDMNISWPRGIKILCDRMSIPFFMKQICSQGRPIPFEEFPSDLQVREYPAGKVLG